jgi:hypothetical protein
MRLIASLVVVALALGGCAAEKDREPSERGLSGTCGLRKVAPDVDEKKVPKEFLLDGVEIAKTTTMKDRFIAIVNAPYSVDEAYRAYLDQVKEAGWNIVNHETEGFEAEIYLTSRAYLGAVQVRTSTCEGKVVVYVSLVDRSKVEAG